MVPHKHFKRLAKKLVHDVLVELWPNFGLWQRLSAGFVDGTSNLLRSDLPVARTHDHFIEANTVLNPMFA
jgi:hypothetical protein